MDFELYYQTLKYVKVSQLFNRITRRFNKPKLNVIAAKLATSDQEFIHHSLYVQSFFANLDMKLLNQTKNIKSADIWNDASLPKLWLYNLHYFDDLAASIKPERTELQLSLIDRWIDENPAPHGNGWEPYPTSLRIVNWVKFFMAHQTATQKQLDNLAQQVDFLAQNIEYHLLGNHLLANAKALIFAGLYFDNVEAKNWLQKGLKIYLKETDEQFLEDGANFELSPMYHAILLVDLLDLVNVMRAFSRKASKPFIDQLSVKINRALKWLRAMSHTDGAISFFNDSTFGIAPANEVIFSYATKLGFDLSETQSSGAIQVFDFKDSGYVCVHAANYSLIADLSQIGPDYIPGHAHADSLSFEFSLGEQRVFVNSGISEYGLRAERLRQRQTPAHNTVQINQEDSSHVWSGFRVAERARILSRNVKVLDNGTALFSAQHDGYKTKKLNCLHQRIWDVSINRIIVKDIIEGEFETVIGFLHLHPDISNVNIGVSKITLETDGYLITLQVDGAAVKLEETTWHPGFGISMANEKLVFEFLQKPMTIDISWNVK